MAKSICFFSAYFYPHIGGVERYTFQLSMELHKMGYDIKVVTFNTDNVSSRERINGVEIYRLPVFNFLKTRFPIPKPNKEFRALMKEISSNNFNYLVANTRFYISTFLANNISRRKRKPLIIIDHGSGHMQMNNLILNFSGSSYEHLITNYLKSNKTLFFGVSEKVNKWLKHFKINSQGVIYNSVDVNYKIMNNCDLRKKYNLPQDSIIIVFAGRLIIEKGILILLNVFKKIASRNSNTYLFVAGDGPLMKDIKTNYSFNHTFILGNIEYDDVMNLLNNSDIVAVPSYYPEGLPTLLLEAGINNCAVIATPQGGTEEVITDNEHGIIIEQKSENSLEDALERLIDDEILRKKLASNLMKRVESDFNWNITAKKFSEYLENNKF